MTSEGVSGAGEAAPEAAEPRSPGPLVRALPRGPEGDHGAKFRVTYAALAALAALAVAALVVLLARPGPAPASAWSPWHPTTKSDADRAAEIASYVASQYRLASGSQLVTVQASDLTVQSIPVSFIAIRSLPDGTLYSQDQIPVLTDASDKTVAYLMCGLGQDCAIEEGTPSVERQRLLRREALELALYTFKYVDGKDYVVAFMPPRPGDKPLYALFFQRSDLAQQLDRPLADTLSQQVPLPNAIPPGEVQLVDALTEPHFFAFRFSQLQDGRAFMVLDDPSRVATTDSSGSGSDSGSGGTTTTGSSDQTNQ